MSSEVCTIMNYNHTITDFSELTHTHIFGNRNKINHCKENK